MSHGPRDRSRDRHQPTHCRPINTLVFWLQRSLMKLTSRVLAAFVLVLASLGLGGAWPAAAAAGNQVADVATPEGAVPEIGVTFDGQYLYYAERNGAVVHRIDVPPACGSPCVTSTATGHVDIPVTAPLNPLGIGGINSMSYDAGRRLLLAVGGVRLSIFQVAKARIATPAFSIRPAAGPPGAFHT